jgi:peptidoglycan/LPS O-acetylase OafA/YrhL
MTSSRIFTSHIDGIRAIAVMAVVLYHLDPSYFPGGFAGVDIFFVISGFVVSLSTARYQSSSLIDILLTFYQKRILRIYPALLVCLLFTFMASALFIPQAWLSSANSRSGIAAFFGFSNFVLAAESGGYFAPKSEFNPFTHTWSLGVEEQFYLTFPFLYCIWAKGKRILSTVIFVLTLLASLAYAALFLQEKPADEFFLIGSRFWELALGVILYQVMALRQITSSPKNIVPKAILNISPLLLIPGFYLANESDAPFPSCLPITLATAAILFVLFGRNRSFAHAVLSSPLFSYIGRISYSLYLWHWPVFVLMRWTIGIETFAQEAMALISTALLATFSYHFIEQPTRYASRLSNRLLVILAGCLVIGLSCLMANKIVKNAPKFSWSVVTRDKNVWDPDGSGIYTANNGCTATATNTPVKGGTLIAFTRSGCDLKPTFHHDVYVLGDSHAAHYAAMLKTFSMNTGSTVYLYQYPGCSFMSMRAWNPGHCDTAAEVISSDINERIKAGDVLFLPSLRIERFVDQWVIFGIEHAREEMFGAAADASRADQLKKYAPLLDRIAHKGANIVFEAPSPNLLFVPYRCSDWFNQTNPICREGRTVPKPLIQELRQPVLDTYQKIGMTVANVSVWDPLPLLCPTDPCEATKENKPLYFDGDHLTYYSNMLLLPSFSSTVMGFDKAR